MFHLRGKDAMQGWIHGDYAGEFINKEDTDITLIVGLHQHSPVKHWAITKPYKASITVRSHYPRTDKIVCHIAENIIGNWHQVNINDPINKDDKTILDKLISLAHEISNNVPHTPKPIVNCSDEDDDYARYLTI